MDPHRLEDGNPSSFDPTVKVFWAERFADFKKIKCGIAEIIVSGHQLAGVLLNHFSNLRYARVRISHAVSHLQKPVERYDDVVRNRGRNYLTRPCNTIPSEGD